MMIFIRTSVIQHFPKNNVQISFLRKVMKMSLSQLWQSSEKALKILVINKIKMFTSSCAK